MKTGRTIRRILLGSAAMVGMLVAILGWQLASRGRGGAPVSTDSDRAGSGELAAHCQGWPAQLVIRPESISVPGDATAWNLLWEGQSLQALSRFMKAPPSDATRIGTFRAQLEVARILSEARDLALASQQRYLELRLAPLPEGEGREVFPFLRAQVAVLGGESVDNAQLKGWLDQIPATSSLAPAAKVLRDMVNEPLPSGLPPRTGSARRLLRYLEPYARALDGLRCPLQGSAARKASVLARWKGTGLLPPPSEWESLLQFGDADFEFAGCAQDAYQHVSLYDAVPLVALSAMLWDGIERARAMDSVMAGILALELRSENPSEAQRRACAAAEEWQEPPEQAAATWLIQGDILSTNALRSQLAHLCTDARPSESCAGSRDEVREAFRRAESRVGACYSTLRLHSPESGADAEALGLYDGVLRRQEIDPALTSGCPPEIRDEVFTLWQGTMRASRWYSMAVALSWCQLDVALMRLEPAPYQLQTLASTEPLFVPLREQVAQLVAFKESTRGSLNPK